MKAFRVALGLETPRRRDNGFTLVEILTTVIIIGLLSALSVPVFAGVQRTAIEATVNSDLRANIPVIVEQHADVYQDREAVLRKIALTNQNTAAFTTSGDTPTTGEWCFQVGHEFTSDDTFWRHFSSKTAQFLPGECEPGEETTPLPLPEEGELPGEETPVPPAPETTPLPTPTVEPTPSEEPAPTEPETEQPEEGDVEGDPAAFNEAYTDGPVTYTPRYQWNAYGPGSATIQVAMTSTSSNLTEWHYVADLNKGPYFGFNPSNIRFNDGQGRATIENGELHIRVINQWNGVSSNRPVTVTFDIQNYMPPVMPEHYTVTVTPDPWANNWYACVDVKVQGTNWFPVRWEHVVDLRSYFANLNNTDPTYQNLIATPVEGAGSKYLVKLQGNGTNNNMVSGSFQTHNAHRICYNPQGATPFVQR